MSGLHQAEAAAEAGMEQALRAERVALWRSQADGWLKEQHEGTLFTADDLVAAIGRPDSGPGRNNVIGAWVGSKAKAGLIEFTGRMSKSSRVEGHGNLQRLWRVCRRERERVGGDAERLGPDGVSSSSGLQRVGGDVGAVAAGPGVSSSPPGRGSAPARVVGEEAVSSSGRELSDLEQPADGDLAEAPPGGPPEMEPGWLMRDLLSEEAA